MHLTQNPCLSLCSDSKHYTLSHHDFQLDQSCSLPLTPCDFQGGSRIGCVVNMAALHSVFLLRWVPQHSSPLHVVMLGIFCCPAAAVLRSWGRAESMGTKNRLTTRWVSHKRKLWVDWPVFIYTSKTNVCFQTFNSKQLLNQKRCSVFC